MRDELKPRSFRDREELRRFQSSLLAAHVRDLAARSPHYKQAFKQKGIDPATVRSLDDLPSLPFTTKDDLARDHAAFLSVPRRAVIDNVATSGSLGAPVPLLLTERDLQRLAENEHNSLVTAGVTPDDVVQVITTLNKRFMAGMAYFLGLRELGAGIVRSGPGAVPQQWELIRSCGTTVLLVVPSFLLKMLDHAEQVGIDPNASGVRKAICIGEAIRDQHGKWNALGTRIRERWDIELLGTYASTEMATACTESHPGSGQHVQARMILVEVIDDNGRQVASGESGEVVVTPFHVEGMPLLRFRTGDVCTWHEGELPDGSYGQWLGPVVGRTQQRMKIKGTTLFPSHVIDVIHSEAAISNFVVIRERDDFGMDNLRILLNLRAVRSGALAGELEDIATRIAERLNVRPEVTLATDREIDRLKHPAGSRKPILFIDTVNDQILKA